jgi:hypothetical protein
MSKASRVHWYFLTAPHLGAPDNTITLTGHLEKDFLARGTFLAHVTPPPSPSTCLSAGLPMPQLICVTEVYQSFVRYLISNEKASWECVPEILISRRHIPLTEGTGCIVARRTAGYSRAGFWCAESVPSLILKKQNLRWKRALVNWKSPSRTT